MGETNFSAEYSQTGPSSWVPPPHVDPRREGNSVRPPPQGSPRPVSLNPAVSLIWTVRDRHTYDALRRSRNRVRRGQITVTWVNGDPSEPPKVGYAIGRRVGGAVDRNLVRRRLRAIVADFAGDLAPGAYLLAAGPGARRVAYRELSADTTAALSQVKANAESSSTLPADKRPRS